MKRNLSLAYNILKNWSSYVCGFPQPVPVGYVIIGTTFHCNAKCMMCNIHEFYKERPALIDRELELDAIFKRLKESGLIKKITHVDLTGGEPFLKKDLKDFIVKLFSLPNIDMVTINTNGMLTDKILNDIAGILKVLRMDKCFSVSISIDGKGEIHDRVRGVKGAFKRVEDTLAGLKELRHKYLNFTIRSNAVIQPANIDYLHEIKDYWSKHDIAGAFSVIQTPFYTLCQESGYDVRKFSGDDINNIKSVFPKSRGMNYYLDNNFKRPLHCFAGHASIFIDPFGSVYPCNFLAGNEKYRMGDIKNTGIDSVWVSQQANEIREKVKACPFLNCWNGCEVDQTMIQFEFIERLVKALSLGFFSYFRLKGLKGFE